MQIGWIWASPNVRVKNEWEFQKCRWEQFLGIGHLSMETGHSKNIAGIRTDSQTKSTAKAMM